MRKSQLQFLAPLFLLLVAAPAFAAFDNSHHDMRTYVSGTTEGCFHCHGRLSSAAVAAQDNVGRVGGLCLARCHGTTSAILTANAGSQPTAGPVVNVATYAATASTPDPTVVYFARSHGRSSTMVRNNSGTTSYAPNATAAAWPYATNATIECTSCHAVHNNANAPFIWAPLAATAANGANGFCESCHVERAGGYINVAPNGMHPINNVVNISATTTRAGSGYTRRPRRIVIQAYTGVARVFDVAAPAATTLTGPYAAARAWNMGGHLTKDGANVNAALVSWDNANMMGCYTCHSAHRTPVDGENALTNVATLSPGSTTWNPLCMGCHGAGTTVATDNVGFDVGMTAWGHPVGAATQNDGGSPARYTSSTGTFKFAVNAAVAANPKHPASQATTSWGANGRVVCTTCHTVHYGTGTNKMLLANLGQGTGSICKACHNGAGIPDQQDTSKGGANSAVQGENNAPNAHHITRSTGIAGFTVGATATATIAASGGPATDNLFVSNPSWNVTASNGLGNLSVSMDCADCHIFSTAGGTAHNW